ncbi:MAG: hypothetical protein EPN97_16915 [Alphaproteobacteria bacterium]|nr:MAG: hypothetical protein EPN97_16915 [Alphaproteobacteria bacterium]
MFKSPKNLFKSSEPLSYAEKVLEAWSIKYRIEEDGSIVVPGDVKLSNQNLDALPDLSAVAVKGSFSCDGNRLTSLKGAPHTVGGGFYCYDNQLETLEGAPQNVGGSFSCERNQLTSLKGAPQTVGWNFSCNGNRLASLQHAPQSVRGDFSCTGNKLANLEHAPRNCRIISDFGNFASWADVPQQLHAAPAVKKTVVKYPRGFNL